MSQEDWTRVDQYFAELLLGDDPALEAALHSSVQAQLPPINVSACQGKFLHLLALIQKAEKILEIGTLGGYSTIWLAKALPPQGRLISLEKDPRHAELARANIANANLAHLVEIRVGAALETLPQIEAEGLAPFDLIFIDADKPNNSEYFKWSVRLSRRGSLIISDNVVRQGSILDETSQDPNVQGIRQFNELLASESRVSAAVVQTVGSKGWDGFAIALVTGH